MNNSKSLKELVKTIIDAPDDYQAAMVTINKIHELFARHTAITGSDASIQNLAAVPTARGKALGLNHAANCLLDYKRTIKFLMAMNHVVNQKLQAEPNKTVNVFYAGCGPYAPFACMIATLFTAQEVNFSLLEINPPSLDAAKKLIQALELEDFITDYFLEDAVTFKVPQPKKYDILYSETLDATLYRECYVPILFNLIPQFNKEITVIPENVIVDLKFAKIHKNGEEVTGTHETPVGLLVDARAAVKAHSNGVEIPAFLPSVSYLLKNMEQFDLVVLDTRVIVHQDITLERWDSSLTIPVEMNLEQPFPDAIMEFTYHMQPEIELKYNLIPQTT